MRRIIVTPAGRERYMRLLARHLNAQRSGFDEWHIWQNTNHQPDVDFFQTLDAKIVTFPHSNPGEGSANIHRFFAEDGHDPEALYLRLDDDIVWLQPDFVDNMFSAREQEKSAFLVSANVINNAICSHLHSRMGLLPVCDYNCVCPKAWGTAEYAENAHRTFLARGYRDFQFSRWWMWPGERFSINAISWSGATFDQFQGVVDWHEESWLTEVATRQYGPAVISGQAVCSHFAFYTQRETLDNTNLLEQYDKLCP